MKRLLSLVCLPLVALAFHGCSSSSSSSPPPEQPQTLNFEISSVLVEDFAPLPLDVSPPFQIISVPFFIAMESVGTVELEFISLSGTFTDTQQGPAFSLTSARMDVYPFFNEGVGISDAPFQWTSGDLDPIEWIGFDNPTSGAYDVEPLQVEILELVEVPFTRTLIGPETVEVIKNFGGESEDPDFWPWATFESFMDVAEAEGSLLEDVQASLANGTRAFLFELGSLINDAIDTIDGNVEALAAGDTLVIPCDLFPDIAPASVEPSIAPESQIVVYLVEDEFNDSYYAFDFTCFMNESSPDDTIRGMALFGSLNIHEYFAADAPYERSAVAEWTSLPVVEIPMQQRGGFQFTEVEVVDKVPQFTNIDVFGPFNFAVFEEDLK